MTDEQLNLADELVKAIHITISTRDGTSVIRTNLMPNHRTMIDDALRAATRPAPTEAVREALEPFAKWADDFKKVYGETSDDVLVAADGDSAITVGMLRDARAALSVGEAVGAPDRPSVNEYASEYEYRAAIKIMSRPKASAP